MINKSEIIPLPKGSKYKNYRYGPIEVVGTLKCSGEGCQEWAAVSIDRRGHIYATCTQYFGAARGCGGSKKGGKIEIDQDLASYQDALARLGPVPSTYGMMISSAWGQKPQETTERAEHERPDTKDLKERVIDGSDSEQRLDRGPDHRGNDGGSPNGSPDGSPDGSERDGGNFWD